MWFKNLQIYRLPVAWPISFATLEEQLARGPFAGRQKTQPSARGWMAPRQDSGFVHVVGGQWLIALGVETALLPQSVVRREVADRADYLEEQQGYKPGRKQLRELKERVTEDLLPRAFSQFRQTYAWIDPTNGFLVIDASSPSRAEELIEHLRHCLDDFPLSLLHVNTSPVSAMADWLAGGEAPAGFTIDQDCELKAAGGRASVKFSHHDLEGTGEHLAEGKLPTKLALTWDDRISFVLTERLEIKRLAFLDLLKEEAETEHADEQFDADFALMTGELSRFIPQLVHVLGGEVFAE